VHARPVLAVQDNLWVHDEDKYDPGAVAVGVHIQQAARKCLSASFWERVGRKGIGLQRHAGNRVDDASGHCSTCSKNPGDNKDRFMTNFLLVISCNN
jgi:hypothetical protein